jgi:hypothetical protein
MTHTPLENTNRLRNAAAVLALSVAAALTAFVLFATISPERSDAQAPPAGAAPQTIKKAVWGLQSHNGQSMFPIYRDLGVGIFQTQVRWDQVAPTKPANPTDPNDPAYKWPSYVDTALEESRKYGITVLIQLIGAPPWANGGQEYIYPATNPQDWADFSTAISKKYPDVRHWMIWGEPNSKRAFGPVVDGPESATAKLKGKQKTAPRLYAQLLDSAYGALKAVSPANLVIGGNSYLATGHPVIRTYQWLRYMTLPNGARPRMDMWGHNPYSYRIPNLKAKQSPRGTVDFSDLGRLTKALDKAFKGKRLRLFLSEWGVPSPGRDQDLLLKVAPKKAVQWVRAAMKIVRTNRRIYTLGWSVPVDTTRNPQGLLDTSLRPKNMYNAFKNG